VCQTVSYAAARVACTDVNNCQLFRSMLHNKTISHEATAAPGTEVCCECPMN